MRVHCNSQFETEEIVLCGYGNSVAQWFQSFMLGQKCIFNIQCRKLWIAFQVNHVGPSATSWIAVTMFVTCSCNYLNGSIDCCLQWRKGHGLYRVRHAKLGVAPNPKAKNVQIRCPAMDSVLHSIQPRKECRIILDNHFPRFSSLTETGGTGRSQLSLPSQVLKQLFKSASRRFKQNSHHGKFCRILGLNPDLLSLL